MVTEYFFNFSILLCGKMEKINFLTRKNIFSKQNISFSKLEKYFFPILPGATLQKGNEISNQNNLLGLKKDRK